MPKRKVGDGRARAHFNARQRRPNFNWLQEKSEEKKAQSKGKKGSKGKQTEENNEEVKDNLPAENGETKTDEAPVSETAGENEAKSE
uniref:Non-histone chromosomal protein HMG-14 n=1 Tax=Salvator merianae TaxID=96440 RepID=A0A8D0EC13_SALMN